MLSCIHYSAILLRINAVMASNPCLAIVPGNLSQSHRKITLFCKRFGVLYSFTSPERFSLVL